MQKCLLLQHWESFSAILLLKLLGGNEQNEADTSGYIDAVHIKGDRW
jgi:hypothetical protein